jgi:uncharacterized protein (TIGR01777 family)
VRVGITGATGLVGGHLVAALQARGDELTVFSRDAARARERLPGVADVVEWEPVSGPAPATALSGLDAIVNLNGAPVDQRWTAEAKRQILDSRAVGTQNLVAGLERAEPRPAVLVSASAAGYYGDRGDEVLDEDAGPGSDFLANVCVAWEAAADGAARLGMRVVKVRTGVALDRSAGALARMLLPFRLGLGGPIASGRQYLPWIALEDLLGIYLAALYQPDWSGPVNACGPEPARSRDFARALGRAVHRPAMVPVSVFALRILFGEVATVLAGGQRMNPRRPLDWGYEFKYPELAAALQAALSSQ